MADKIIVLDRHKAAVADLITALQEQGYYVSFAASCIEMGLLLETQDYDLIISEVDIPDVDGFDIIKGLRKESDIPIIMYSDRDHLVDKVLALELGADDYAPKSCDIREVLARIKSVLRRLRATSVSIAKNVTNFYHFAGITLDVPGRTVSSHAGGDICLTSTEFIVLLGIVEGQGEAVSRGDLIKKLYGSSVVVTDRTIDAHVARLRRKLAAASIDRDIVKTVHGAGYTIASKIECGLTPIYLQETPILGTVAAE